MVWPFGKKCPYCGSKNVTMDKENNALLCNDCDKVSKLKEELKEEKIKKEKITYGGIVAFSLNIWKIIFRIPHILFVWWLLFLYEIPYWIPEVGRNTAIGYLSGINIGGIYINGFANIIGLGLMAMVILMLYTSIYKEPFSAKKWLVDLIVHGIYIGIGFAFFVLLLPNVPVYYDYLVEKGGYFGCLIGSGFNEKACTSAEKLVEKINKIGGTAGYGSVDVKLGIKDLGYTISNPEAGKRYKLYFTVFNRMNKKLEDVSILVKSGETEATVNKCDYKSEPCDLEEGENGFYADFEKIPETMVNFRPIIYVRYTQSVEGTNKFKIIWSESAYDKNYKPVCAEEGGKIYYCPSTTQGPVDIIPSFIEKQVVSEEENKVADLTVCVANMGTGYARLYNAKINQVVDAKYKVTINCPTDMFDEFTITPKGSAITGGAYKERKDFYCDVTIPYKLSESEISKEVTIKASFNYEYVYEFKQNPMSVIH